LLLYYANFKLFNYSKSRLYNTVYLLIGNRRIQICCCYEISNLLRNSISWNLRIFYI